jgi:uncharacterized membrane protein
MELSWNMRAVLGSPMDLKYACMAAPSGVVLDTDEEIDSEALRIHQQTVVLKAMPIGNLTEISEEERALIDAWYQGHVQQE